MEIRNQKVFMKKKYKYDWSDSINEIILKYSKSLQEYNEDNGNLVICPEDENVFKAFELTQQKNLKLIFIGQDPYYLLDKTNNRPIADGLAFSTCSSKRPTTLGKIFSKLKINPKSNSLESWAKNGCLLLNFALTVRNKPTSDYSIWNGFAEKVIDLILIRNSEVPIITLGKKSKSLLENVKSKNKFCYGHPNASTGEFGKSNFDQIFKQKMGDDFWADIEN